MFKEGVKQFYAQETNHKLRATGNDKLEVPSIAFSAAVPNVAHKTLGDFIGEISKDHILTKQEKLQMSISWDEIKVILWPAQPRYCLGGGKAYLVPDLG